ncbi:hypothetical protein BBJ29_003991 [Phytophthora kernoviae]|uniref:HAT C-terminal dimerisation domain-containing protein n=1 Tax=Phytophthora kernoviae TaxID=325452 RepID=A0A3F2RL83_9STRA|nr:hypothetical protein BBJ29_003991 [Phytophthora kernoviae]RLN59706.1 hypothetical protein BBP00_00006359 [Phytophthora kernoviae]
MVPGKWKQTLDPRFVRMKYLSDSEREICKARLIDQCFALANFTQLMANQRYKMASTLSAPGVNTITTGVNGGLDPTSTPFLDFQSNRDDQDTNNFLRELLFEDTHDDPALVYQQQQQSQLADSFVPGQVSTGPGVSTSASDATTSAYIEQEMGLRLRVADEVKGYYEAVASAKVTAMRDPLRWWRDNTTTFPLLVPLARQWLGSVGSVRPSGIVQIGTDALDTTATNSNGQGLHPNVTTGVALPPGNFAVHSEPELVRDLVFVHNNC